MSIVHRCWTWLAFRIEKRRHTHELPEGNVSRHARRIVAAVLVPAAVATLLAMILLWPGRVHLGGAEAGGDRAEGTITTLTVATATVWITEGPGKGTTVTADLSTGPGSPPLLVAVVGASAIMFAALYLTHGVNLHTSVAIAGALVSLVLTGLLGAAFTTALRLTGVAGDDDGLAATQRGIDMRGLLLAGIVIGALGVLGDVTVTQAATVAELSESGGGTRWEIYRAASRIGRAHVGSAVNTLVLAYAGAALPVLLLLAAGSRPVSQVLTGELLAQEVLRSAVGTIGLVASVPITTALAALVADPAGSRSADRRNSPPDRLPRHSRT
jgi:hypothetical protein